MRIAWISALVSALVLVAIDLYIFFDIRRLVSRRWRTASCVTYGVFTLACWALAIVVLALPKRDADVDLTPIMWMMFVLMSVYLPKLLYCLCSLVGRLFGGRNKAHGPQRYAAWVGMIVAVAVFVGLWWGVLVTRNSIETNRVELTSARLPESFNGYKVLQFSDAHVGTWGSDTTFMSKLVDSINAQKPDLILFTGDIVTRRSAELDPFLPVLRRLRARDGVMAVHGNHDYASYVDWPEGFNPNNDVARLDSMLHSIDWKVLNNQTAFVSHGNDSIVVIGMENWGEPPFNQIGDLGKSYPDDPDRQRGLNDNMFKILMTHNPMYWRHAVTKISNVDLSLAGHTHAMQMMLKVGKRKYSPSVLRYPEWGGLYTDTASDGSPMHLYVNIGVGEVGFPARLGDAKPELTLFTLHKTDK